MIIEIMYKLLITEDYMSILCTCKRIFGLKSRLAKLQDDTNVKIQTSSLYENKFGRAIVIVDGNEAIAASFHTKLYDTIKMERKYRFKKQHHDNIQNLCKLAGNVVTFRKWEFKNNQWIYPPTKKYISIHFSWVSNEMIWIKVNDGKNTQKIRLYESTSDIRVRLAEFYDMYFYYQSMPEFKEFPGELLRMALDRLDSIPVARTPPN